jgi:ketosteroid isomerase-like protein
MLPADPDASKATTLRIAPTSTMSRDVIRRRAQFTPVDLEDVRCETAGMDDFSATVVFRWLAAGDAGDVDAFDRLLHPDAIIHAPAGLSTANVEEEKAVWRDALAAMPDLRHDVQEVLVDGDVEMARVVVTATLSMPFGGVEGTGRSFRIDQAVITHLRDGKVAEAWEIADIAALRAQVDDG